LRIADCGLKILLIRLRMIGDVVFTTPAIRALRRRFPDAHLSYLVEEQAAPIVRGNPHLDEVIVIPLTFGVTRIADDWRIGGELRRRAFDVVVDFHGGPRGSLLTWLTRARQRIGYTVVGRSWMYTQAIDRPRALRSRHSVENQWDLLTPLGVPPPDRARDAVNMAEVDAARQRVDAALSAARVPQGAPIVVLHVSAGNPFRRWPLEHFANTAASLVNRDARRYVVLTSGPSETDAADRVGQLARSALPSALADHVARCGEFPLEDLKSLVGRAALYIGGDSGPLHVAATTSTPIVGIYGPTLPARSAPWRDLSLPAEAVELHDLACRPCNQRICVHGDFRCLSRLTPPMVVDAAERALATAQLRRPASASGVAGERLEISGGKTPDVAHFGSQS
jgi:lipopolysaccharide heptosyltransferase II